MSDFSSADVRWLDVSRETFDRLVAYQDLVIKWNDAINLVSRGSIPDLWARHILDSAQIATLAPEGPKLWADLGSGGGFPGIVAAIQLKAVSPETSFTLIESDARKATFLRQAIRLFELNAEVLAQRVEAVQPLRAQVLSARALAPLSQLLEYAKRHLSEDGRAFFPKGGSYPEEIRQARQWWNFRVRTHISRTDANAAILEVDQIDKI